MFHVNIHIIDSFRAAGNAGEGNKSKGRKRGAATENNIALKDFTIEYAKSSRSTCRGCEEKIMKVR
jgi:poly [ADP-ribose] polymerase